MKSDIEILIDTISAIKSILPQKSDQLDPESVSETVSETAEPNQLSTSILVKLEEINLNDIKNKANQPLPTPNQDPIPINACVDPSAPVTKCLGESLSSIATLVQTIPSWAVWKKILELVQFNEKDSDSLDSISSKLSTLETEKSSLNTRLNELEVKLKGDFGNNDIFLSVYKKCIDVDTPEYIYEICLFGDIHQKPKSGGSSTLVGKYTRWGGRDAKTVYNKMMFENGQTCWNGPARSVEVDIECGEKEAGLSVSETSKCEYLMKIASPLVCQEVKINDEL